LPLASVERGRKRGPPRAIRWLTWEAPSLHPSPGTFRLGPTEAVKPGSANSRGALAQRRGRLVFPADRIFPT